MPEQPHLFPTPARRRRRGRSRRAYDQSIRALRDTGRIEPADTALIAVGRAAFDLLDEAEADGAESRFTRRACIAEARATFLAIRDRYGDDLADVDLADLFAAVGDPADGPAD